MELTQRSYASAILAPIFIVFGYTGYVRGYSYLKFIKFNAEENIISNITLVIGLLLLFVFIIKAILVYRNILIIKSIFCSLYFVFLILSVSIVYFSYVLNINLYFIAFLVSLFSSFSVGRIQVISRNW